MSTRNLIALTTLVLVLVGVATFMLDASSLSALGSIVAAGGSLVAVLWFSASLRHQAAQLDAQMKQLADQRVQFEAQYQHLRETSRRDALLLARDILEKAEVEALRAGPWANVGELITAYMRFDELAPLTKSRDPEEVLAAFRSWSVKEVASCTFMAGIKSAAEVYLKSTGTPDIDFDKAPEDFYMIYSGWFEKEPFFARVAGPASMLAGILSRLQPGRQAAQIAFFVASDMTIPKGIIVAEKVRGDIEKQRVAGYPVPAIAEQY